MENAQDSLRLVEGHVANTLKNMLYIANFVQIDTEMNAILKERATIEPSEQAEDYAHFSDTQRIISKIDNISIIGDEVMVTILLPNGIYYANYPRHDYDPHHIFEATWFGELEQLKGLESMWIGAEPYVISNKYLYAVTLARTLRFPNSKVYGYVVITVNQAHISSIFDRIATNQEMLLLDQSDRIIAHNQTERIGEHFTWQKNLNHIGQSDIVEMDGAQYLVSVKEVSTVTGWKLVSLIPYREAVSNINRIYNVVLVLQLVSFVIFLLILIFLLQRFTRPLVRLGRLAGVVQRGNLEVRSYIKGQDEIGRLGQSFDQMLNRIKEMIQEVTIKEGQKREAELAMLQAQIHPHFMFNVLNSIRMKVLHKGDDESAEMISSLSRFMRMSIGSTDDDITLYEEIGIIVDYLKLMNLRQKEKIKLALQIPSDTFLEEVPRFVLQPIVENALVHGLDQRAGQVTISANIEHEVLVIQVQDNGKGMTADRLAHIQSMIMKNDEAMVTKQSDHHRSFGLRNVKERMRIKFGEPFEMLVQSMIDAGTCVELRIPRKVSDNHVQSDDGR